MNKNINISLPRQIVPFAWPTTQTPTNQPPNDPPKFCSWKKYNYRKISKIRARIHQQQQQQQQQFKFPANKQKISTHNCNHFSSSAQNTFSRNAKDKQRTTRNNFIFTRKTILVVFYPIVPDFYFSFNALTSHNWFRINIPASLYCEAGCGFSDLKKILFKKIFYV